MKTIKMTIIMLVLAMAFPLQAQINLKKLGKQIKKSAEGQVEQKIKEKAARETRQALDRTEKKVDQAVQGATSGKASGKSAATKSRAARQQIEGEESLLEAESSTSSSARNKSRAAAQDTGATTNIIQDEGDPDPYLGVAIGENVYDHYGKLSDEIYYRWENYWYKSAEESLGWLEAEMWVFLDALAAAADGLPMVVKEFGGGAHLLVGEMSMNAYFALFSARPDVAYSLFVRARAFLNEIEKGNISDNYEDPNVVVAYLIDKDGAANPTYGPSPYMKYGYGFQSGHIKDYFNKYKGDRVSRWRDEESRLMDLYRKNVSYETVKATTINMLTLTAQGVKEELWHIPAINSYYLDILVNDLKNHPDKIEDDDYNFIVETHAKWSASNYAQWRGESQKTWEILYSDNQEYFKGAVSIPKAAISNLKLEAEMLVIAKTIFDDGRVPVKAIIKNPDWDYDRNALGQIINRFQTAYIIYKMPDGTHRMVDIGFKQMYNGSSYGKTQSRGIGLVNQVVEYNQ